MRACVRALGWWVSWLPFLGHESHIQVLELLPRALGLAKVLQRGRDARVDPEAGERQVAREPVPAIAAHHPAEDVLEREAVQWVVRLASGHRRLSPGALPSGPDSGAPRGHYPTRARLTYAA